MRQTTQSVSPMSNEGRNLYVVEHITQALLKRLQDSPIGELSILQICEEAGVGRASFYRNFVSKEDVLRKHLMRLIREWSNTFENRNDPNYFSESLLRHFYQHRDFYLLLYKQGLSEMIYENIRWASKLDEATTNMERYARSMVAGMIFGWADEWMRQGMPETPDELMLLTAQNEKNQNERMGNI